MSKFISFLFLCFASLATFAQVADLKVSYDYQHYSPDGRGINSQMVLLANNDESKFFNILNERVDPMMVTPEGRMAYGQMVQAAMAKKDVSNLPIKKEPMYVLKSRKDSLTSVYDLVGADYWFYEEPLVAQQWEISDSTKTILGYECVKATCDYRGRHWTAWFTPEIPIQDGPWKLYGLPGLILIAEDSSGQYSFVADGIQNSTDIIRPIFGKENYEKTNRIKYLQAMRAFTNNPVEYMKASTGADITNIPKIEIDESYDFLEKDYR